jgi:class 3 adenylate cyclase/predicted ATPase
MECSSCKAAISENSRFCGACGTALAARCPACSQANPPRAKFCTSCGYKLDAKSPETTPKDQSPSEPAPPNGSAERRQLTVLFCDLVGSTALAARLDLEDLREVVGVYHRCVAATVNRFGGFVAKYMGDGVLAYFGYPEAHEDDAQQAVRTGLALIDDVGRLRSSEPLRIRVGISTGLVVVGDLVGVGEAQERGVVGETPNLAARLQSAAAPNTVAIGPMTRRLLGDLFACRDLGHLALKGFPERVQAYQVLGKSGVESQSEALYGAAPTPLVGRDEEIDQLSRQWQRAKNGEGRAMLLSGEPGIGKSRLAATLQERLHSEPHYCLRYFCSAHHADSALHPITAQLERAAGFEHEDTSEKKLDKLELLLVPNAPPKEDVALLAELLSIPAGDRLPILNLSPQRKKEKTFEVLLGQLDSLTRQRPLLMIFEDVHWIDPSSRELLDLVVERVAVSPILLLISFRPEFNPPWTGQSHVRAMVLSRLDRREGTALVQRVIGDKTVSGELVEEIVRRTDGVPLFIEELTKAVLEADGEGAKATPSKTLPTNLVVPSTLHASLMARLDRLGPAAKEVAQVGAAIGREFRYELLIAASDRTAEELKTALDRLADAGLVFRRGTPPEATYTFKHALVQDASYGTLLRVPRQQLHARIATALEQRFPDIAATQPEVLARHLTEAGLVESAVAQWQKAGEKAVRRAANKEAIEHFRRALSLSEVLPHTLERRRTELAILSQLGPALMSIHGWTAPEVGAVFDRAGEVARQLGNQADLAPPLVGLWLYHTSRGQFERADDISVELFKIARKLDDPEILLQAHHAAWATSLFRCQLAQACEHLDAGMALYDEKRHERHRFLYIGHDPAVCALGIGASVQWMLGHPERAVRLEREVIELARRLQHAPSLAHGLSWVGESQIARGDATATILTAKELLTLSDEHRLPQPRATALMFLGWAMARTGGVQEGTERLTEGIGLGNQLGTRIFLPRALCLLAETHGLAQRYSEGLEQIAQALAVSEETGETWYLSHLHHLRASLLRAKGKNTDAAETSLRTALDVARAQNARGWELRAATSLGRLWCEQGKRAEARDLVAPIYGCFSEGFETPDLREAKALLDDLGTPGR